MKIDEKVAGLGMSENQHYFVSCWHNVIHGQSLDSHRIRTMNARNALREFMRMVAAPHANDSDREMVCHEAELIIAADQILNVPPLAISAERFLHVLKRANAKKQKPAQDQKKQKSVQDPGPYGLAVHLARELSDLVDTHYVHVAFGRLETLTSSVDPADKETIDQLTVALLSTLIDAGASLESLYQLYRNVLVPRTPKNYQFIKKFGLLKTLVLQQPIEHKVLFMIDGVTNTTDFPETLGQVSFSTKVENWNLNSSVLNAYATPQSRRLFAEVKVVARDIRVAGTDAYQQIGNILDLTRFEHERERVQLSTEFLVEETGKLVGKKTVRRLSIPKLVPNPAAGMGAQELSLFVESVNQLMSSARFQHEDRDRVLSAFRLYRQGADATSFESKLVTWWSAIEYLIRGMKKHPIGTVVENRLTPLLGLVYGEKLLVDVRQTLINARAQPLDPVTDLPLQYREMPMGEFRALLCSPNISDSILDAVKADPFVHERIKKIMGVVSSAQAYLKMLNDHDQRVRWQIQRLWRSRCDIVHSAQLHLSGVLLCANLEWYLKVILTALLSELRSVKTLCSPEEFFERQELTYTRLRESLQSGALNALDAHLNLSANS